MGRMYIVKEFWDFIKYEKKWWLAPILTVLGLMAMFVLLGQAPALAPFISPLS